MNIIKKFNQIDIIPNSLVVFDIDETLIKFDGVDYKWWKNKFNKYFKMTNNSDLADYLANKDWIDLVSKIDPDLVDEEIYNFINKLKDYNCQIIFLTARNDVLKTLTYQHLHKVNLLIDHQHIYFNQYKGDELFKLTNEKYTDIENIIVIDDIKENLSDIKEKMQNTKFNLFLYNIKL